MADNTTTLFCKNPACNYSETRQCVEGNDLAECTYLQEAESESSDVDLSDDLAREESPLVRLSGGGYLSLAQASALMKQEPGKLVAFLGPVAAGKTSLVAEIYDAFQYAQYQSLEFAGSDTLTSFEQISHSVRAAARTDAPVLDRTEMTDEPLLYHLRIAGAMGPVNILLADRSGETYSQIADNPKVAAECLELKRAIAINVLVDGERLCNTATRASALTQCTQAIQALALTGLLERDTNINLVLTKLDAVDAHEHRERAHKDFDSLPDRIQKQCQGRVGAISLFEVAACPHNGLYEKGHGVENLVNSWMNAKPKPVLFSASSNLISKRSIDFAPASVEEL